jgi:hypothetical protein
MILTFYEYHALFFCAFLQDGLRERFTERKTAEESRRGASFFLPYLLDVLRDRI